MGDNWIIVVPDKEDFVPSPDRRRKALELFRSIAPYADEIREEVTEEVRFIDCGANLERVVCPKCGVELDIEWWRQKMDEEAESGFALRRSALPCCGASCSLAELQYDWPQAFARFSIEAMNPKIGDLIHDQLHSFEFALGCRVRTVLRRV